MPTPEEIKAEYPLSEEGKRAKAANDAVIRDILTGNSDKLLLIIGPCSADREDAVLDYIHRLRTVQEDVKEVIHIIPRIFTNKPRTTGAGYKGMLHQPNPLEHPDLLKGLMASRKLHVDAIHETGFSCADEMLYPENHLVLSDVLSYVSVGARSVENQQHRLTASALDVPVGMKNPICGDLKVMIESIRTAQKGHTFIYRNWEVESQGNPLTHAMLRGYVDNNGKAYPNYHIEDLLRVADLYSLSGALNPAVIVDCNHSNSWKKSDEQIPIAKEVLHSAHVSEPLHRLIKGLMVESYIEDGCQKASEGVYGKSITDPCLGWEKTRRLIYELAELR